MGMDRRRPEAQAPLRTVEFHILLSLAGGESHGYGIINDIKARDASAVPDVGTMYRALARMAEHGLIDLLSTDHHGPRRQGVSPREALEALIARGQVTLAERAMEEVPGMIARNEPITSRLPR